MWTLRLRGGAFDGGSGECTEPSEVLIVWGDKTKWWATDDPHNPTIVLRTAESYRLVERDDDERIALYEVGEQSPGPQIEDRAFVPVGAACWAGPPAWAQP